MSSLLHLAIQTMILLNLCTFFSTKVSQSKLATVVRDYLELALLFSREESCTTFRLLQECFIFFPLVHLLTESVSTFHSYGSLKVEFSHL